jgi:hypothetical protein
LQKEFVMNIVILVALIFASPYWSLGENGACPKKCAAYEVSKAHQPVAQAQYAIGAPAASSYVFVSGAQDGRSDKSPKGSAKKSGEATAPGEDDQKGVVVLKRKAVEPDDANRASQGWLGVSIGPVPEPLAAQLGTESRGLLVLNVIENSPADKAGIRPHDVIVSIGGEEVEADVHSMVNLIAEREPGETMRIVLLRKGEDVTVDATLGSRADQEAAQFEWKIEGMPDAELEEQIKTRGRFMFKSPQGEWVLRDLGDIADMDDLPDKVKMMLPESGSRSVQVFVEDGETKIRARVERDGEVIEVEREGEGQISVTRTDDEGNESTKTYPTQEQLAQQDPEAHEILEDVEVGVVDGVGDNQFHFNIDLDGDLHAMPLNPLWDEHMQESLQRAQEAYERAMEEMRRLQQGRFEPQGRMFSAPPDGSGPHFFMQQLGKPRHTFEVRTDGAIEVRIRKGDSELVQLYENEDDLAKRAPDLAAKYRELMDAADE